MCSARIGNKKTKRQVGSRKKKGTISFLKSKIQIRRVFLKANRNISFLHKKSITSQDHQVGKGKANNIEKDIR